MKKMIMAVMLAATTLTLIAGELENIVKAYDANPLKADSVYKDKRVTVTGNVDAIDRDVMGNPYLSLGKITAYFPVSSEAQITRVEKGKTVTVAGICGGKVFGSVVLNKAELVK